ncbi:hypothetical protein M8C21_029597, partial [Ambrosia artemisiifolia]
LQKEAKVPVPIEEELVEKVEEVVGHVLSWPRHLVIHCSDLEKAVAKKKIKHVNINKKQEAVDKEKNLKEVDHVGTKRKNVKEAAEKGKEKEVVDEEKKRENERQFKNKGQSKKEAKAKRQIIQKVGRKIMTRAKRKERVRMGGSVVLKMAAHVVDGSLKKEDTIRLSFDEDIFGHDSFTYINWNDFEAVFTIDELSGAVISSYIINHWVLAVLDMRKATCYYLDSLSPISFLEQLKQIIDMAMVIYAVQSGTGKVKLNWVNT